MGDTTSINDLPSGGINKGPNISMEITDNVVINGKSFNQSSQPSQPSQPNYPNQVSLDPSTIQQLISGLQQSGGATMLPSRDIPTNTEGITQDVQVQPNYIADTSRNDYIREYEENDDIITKHKKKEEFDRNLDSLYDEIQGPLLVALLFFLFQLPVVKKSFYSFFPMFYSSDGNLNLNGYLFNSALFGILCHILFRTVNFFK